MRTKHRLLICTVALGTIPIALSGCGSGSNSPIPSSIGAAPFRELALGPYRTLYKFRKTGRDGSDPNGQLTALNGVLYGTTYSGGPGDGTVFSLTTSGEERVLYGFKGGSNGDNPNAGLVAVNGVLYGTTVTGGGGCPQQEGCGTVFAVTTSGQQRVIYHFKGGRDGYSPAGGLTLLGGRLYGTTSLGGSSQGCAQSESGTGCGTIFSVDTSGHETILHRFRGKSDGQSPTAPLLALNGKLYGTTTWGGTAGSCDYDCGTIFSVTTSGVETTLYKFMGASDGAAPYGSVISLHGMLYGTTNGGGVDPWGTVFKSTISGDESPIYTFKSLPDAQSPTGVLTADHGVLYGTASGGRSCEQYFYSGTIFAVTTAGAERVVYTYPCRPLSYVSPGLLLFDATLYGTTYQGGKGAGTVFTYTP